MKRLTTYLGALVALLALTLFAPQLAHAQTITCPNVNANTKWPGGVYSRYCTNTTLSQGESMFNGLQSVGGASGPEAVGQAQVTYYLFNTPADYKTYATANSLTYVAPGNNDYGVTYFDSNHKPIYSAIFVQNLAGRTNAYIGNAAAHEEGDAINWLLGYVPNGGVIVGTRVSFAASTLFPLFTNSLSTDWTTANNLPQCVSNGTGYFNKQADPTLTGTQYLCMGTNGGGAPLFPTYANLTACLATPPNTCNESILQKIWIKPFGSSNTDQLLAEEIAYNASQRNDGVFATDHYIGPGSGAQFACTTKLASNLVQFGKASNATGCPAPSPATTCIDFFNGYTWPMPFPFGWTFDCIAGQTTSFTDPLVSSLANIGKFTVGGQTTYPIQAFLQAVPAYIYLFPDQTTFSTTFTNAKLSTANMTLEGFYGFSAPIGSIWYIVINEGSTAGTDTGKQRYIVSHELGHVVDMNTGQHSADAQMTGFDLAMQHDWQNLDWETYSTRTERQKCWINGSSGATYNGPLLGLIDPLTSKPFCAGGVLVQGSSVWSTKPNSYIVDYVARQPLLQTREIRYQNSPLPLGNSPGVTAQPGWREWFAQSFAIVAASDVSGTSNLPVLDQVVKNGYFGCTAGNGGAGANGITLLQGWMYFVYTKQNTNMIPATCSVAMPGWTEYRPIDSGT